MDRIHHDAIPRRLRGGRRRRYAVRRVQKTLIVARIMLLMESGGQTEVGELDVTILVN